MTTTATTTLAPQPPYPQVPVLESNNAIIALVVNVILPGIGTIIAGVLGQRPMIGRGIAQLLLSFIIVGWIWAIITGVQLLQNATWQAKRVAPVA